MRCFVAVELAPALRAPLVRLLRQELPPGRDVRWCTEQQLHVTLKFLGEVPAARLEAVCAAVAAASRDIEPFPLRLHGLGAFPGRGSPRVLWCGVEDPAGGCARWVRSADALLAPLGFAPEARAFHPHVTLGRSRGSAGAGLLRRVLAEVAAPSTPEMNVTEVVLFESRLAPTGAQYTPQFRARLGRQ